LWVGGCWAKPPREKKKAGTSFPALIHLRVEFSACKWFHTLPPLVKNNPRPLIQIKAASMNARIINAYESWMCE
jgi:hypothetical protein